jgi:CubicO group peptidase (beta-lactamase class C family)
VSERFTAAREVLEQAVANRVSPGAVIEVGDTTRPLWIHATGRLTYEPTAPLTDVSTIFDLASLTKVVSTAPLVMRQISRGILGLNDPVSSHIERWRGGDRESVTIQDLLSHASGLPAYRPLHAEHRGLDAYVQAISTLALEYPPRSTAVYSDLDFILLGAILERMGPLSSQFEAMRTQIPIASELQFSPPASWQRRTAPTRQSPERQRLLLGEVDDENAWALGSSAGHAGLFGTASAVGEYARHLLQILDGRSGALDEGLLRTFISRRTEIPGSSRALAWDTMLPSSSCGTRMSPAAFGHTGFTGTSLWIDPDRRADPSGPAGIYVVLLTNRVHPIPGDAALIRQVRRDVHDAVMDAVAPANG